MISSLRLSFLAALGAVRLCAQEAAPATPVPNRFTPEQRVKNLTAILTLTAEQQVKVKAIIEEGRGRLEQLRALPVEERRARANEYRQAEQEKILAVLTPEQQAKFKTEVIDRAAAARARLQAPRRAGETTGSEKKAER